MVSKRITDSAKIQALRGNDRARFMYVALLPHTDPAGRVNVNPHGLAGTLFEPFEYTVDDVRDALFDLAEVGLLTLYRTTKHDLLAEYVRFRDFNTPHPKEGESDYPGPEDAGSELVARSGMIPGPFPDDSRKRPGGVVGTPPGKVRDADPGSGPERVGSSQTSGQGLGSFPEASGKKQVARPSPTPTPTQFSIKEEDTPENLDASPEARFGRLAETGSSEHAEASRTRAVIRRLAGEKFARENERNMPAWSRHPTDRLTILWQASDPSLWPREPGKRRTWFFIDLLNEERYPPGEPPPSEVKRPRNRKLTGSDLLDMATTLHGKWGGN